jgi:hypothetical protein
MYHISSALIHIALTAFENNILYTIKHPFPLLIPGFKGHIPTIHIKPRLKCDKIALFLRRNRSTRSQRILARHWESLRSPRPVLVSSRVLLHCFRLMACLASYIRRQVKNETEPEGPVHDDEVDLPPMSNTAGSQIRIPPALMPTDEDSLHYFKVFFADIHPYVPVVVRSHLYQQWQSNKGSISPLLLEAIFACAGRLSDDPAQGAQWLALANSKDSTWSQNSKQD